MESGAHQPIRIGAVVSARDSLLIERLYADFSRAVFTILHAHAPRLATDLAVLDVLLRGSATGIDRDLHRIAISTDSLQ